MKVHCTSAIDYRAAADIVQRAVTVEEVLRHIVSWRVRGRGRCDCGLCQADHSQHGTVSFNDGKGVWHCFRCQAGCDAIRLIELAHKCSFKSALAFLADRAGVQLPNASQLSAAERARLREEAAERQKREAQLDKATDESLARFHIMRRHCTQQIHRCDEILRKSAPWSKADWSNAKGAHARREKLLVEFALLAFGSMSDRVHYLQASQQERGEMLDRIRMLGGFYATGDEDDPPHFVELVTT